MPLDSLNSHTNTCYRYKRNRVDQADFAIPHWRRLARHATK
jgi:hypothetical protein